MRRTLGPRLVPFSFTVAVLGSVLVACSHHPASTGPTPVTPTLPTSGRPTTGGGGHNLYHGVKLPASAFKRNTWGFIGCSNTHDTIWGYHNAPGTADLFWPYLPQYRIEGQVILDWADPNSQDWHLFDLMKQRYNHGSDPPVVWVQLCENLSLTQRSTYGIATVSDVRAELTNLKAHAPTSVVFVSPLQSYSPPTLCALMGAGGKGVDDLKKLADEAVKQGLAKPGPGADSVPNLGPLTQQTAFRDGCHPTGDPHHGPGPGAVFLGQQLATFFDHIPKA